MKFFCQPNISDKVTKFEISCACRTRDNKSGPHFMFGLYIAAKSSSSHDDDVVDEIMSLKSFVKVEIEVNLVRI